MEDIVIKSEGGVPNLVQNEEKILKFWKEKNILEKSIEQRDKGKSFTFASKAMLPFQFVFTLCFIIKFSLAKL